MRSASGPWWQPWGFLVPGLAWVGWFIASTATSPATGTWFTLFDDAAISLTYGRTLARTGELVWFAGAPRVEGFTNPLWTLYLALLQLLGLSGSAAALAVILTGVALLVGCALLVRRVLLATLAPAGEFSANLAAAAVPFLYPLAHWSLRGMEVGLLALAALLMVDALVRSWRSVGTSGRLLTIAGLAAAVGVTTRLDFAVVAAVIAGWWWWGDRSWGRAIALGGPVIGSVLLVVSWQAAYYGDPLPNTYHLKLDEVPLAARLAVGLLTLGKLLPALLCLVAAWLVVRRLGTEVERRMARLSLSAVAAEVAYHVWVGGDAWEDFGFGNRFVAVVLPLALILVTLGATGWVRAGCPRLGRALVPLLFVAVSGLGAGVRTTGFVPVLAVFQIAPLLVLLALARVLLRRRGRTAVVLLLATFLVATSWVGLVSQAAFVPRDTAWEHPLVRDGRRLAEITTPDAVIAVLQAGTVAYYADRPMVDVLGKSDRQVAQAPVRTELDGLALALRPGHNKWDIEHSLGRLRPDVVYDLWRAPSWLRRAEELGYVERCTADGVLMHFRSDSSRIAWAALRSCTDAEVAAADLERFGEVPLR